jgi:hypothetical protein
MYKLTLRITATQVVEPAEEESPFADAQPKDPVARDEQLPNMVSKMMNLVTSNKPLPFLRGAGMPATILTQQRSYDVHVESHDELLEILRKLEAAVVALPAAPSASGPELGYPIGGM